MGIPHDFWNPPVGTCMLCFWRPRSISTCSAPGACRGIPKGAMGPKIHPCWARNHSRSMAPHKLLLQHGGSLQRSTAHCAADLNSWEEIIHNGEEKRQIIWQELWHLKAASAWRFAAESLNDPMPLDGILVNSVCWGQFPTTESMWLRCWRWNLALRGSAGCFHPVMRIATLNKTGPSKWQLQSVRDHSTRPTTQSIFHHGSKCNGNVWKSQQWKMALL